jgi:transcriptional regulator with XRE-family HTH domain
MLHVAAFVNRHTRMSTSLSTRFGRAVRRLREDSGISQETFAHKANIGRAYYSAIERGRTNPSLEMIGRIAKALGVRLGELFAAVDQE